MKKLTKLPMSPNDESGKIFNWVNMVRAGVVGHPSEWGRFSGYNEIQKPRKRYSPIDHAQLVSLLGKKGMGELVDSHATWVAEALELESKPRDVKWTESIAVGSKGFVEKIKEKLGALFLSRKAEGEQEAYVLRDPPQPYEIAENRFPWRS